MPLHFNKTADLKLLQLVKENQILYNTKHPNYIDFDAREVVWQKIGDALRRPAAIFAGIQCQVQYGDFNEEKHKPGFIENLEEYLPQQYCNSWGIEKKIYKAFKKYQGQSSLDAKYTYIKTARDLPTYGVTFFLVKEKQKGKKKLIPRLLGINAESILRLDHDTKEILQSWPLTHVKTYHTGKTEMFTLNFGEYSDKEYSVKTQDAYRIRDILEGYIDIIRRRMFAKPGCDGSESMAICDDNVTSGQAHLIQHVSQNPTKMVEASFVGPQRIVPYEAGQSAQSGTQIVTVQRIMVADHAQHQQQALKGEVPLRSDMSMDCARKLNRMNSNSVKIVNLLTEPDNEALKETQKIVDSMQEDLPIVQKGIKETAEKQSAEDSRKMLMNELEELNNYMKQLDEYTKPETMNTESAKEAAENIAGLTTQICFSLDNKIQKRNDIMRRSRKSFIEDEKTLASIRRGSLIAAATTALHSMDTAKKALAETYSGPHIDDTQKKRLEKSLEDKMGKLNAALALYLTAHSDPENVDYSTAINSMNTINELMPQLALDAQMYASSLDPEARKQYLADMRTLLEAASKICTVSNSEDREKIQEAANTYADAAGKLIFTFARGKNAEKENEIIELAQDVAAKTSVLLMSANELTGLVPDAPAAADVDDAGADTATAARDLLACAQLTAPAIREPHCQSALTAAAENLSSSVQHLETSWKPLLDQPTVKPMGGQLRARVVDVNKALQRLKDAYQSLNEDVEDDVNDTQQKELSRLKFIKSISGVKDKLQSVENEWGKTTSPPTAEQQQLAQHRLQQQLARLNAAVAALASATADSENIDHEAAEKAACTISELLPLIMKDGDTATYGQDETARTAMLDHLKSLCNATRNICAAAGEEQGIPSSAADFAAASNKLTFLISPYADRSKEEQIMDLTASACAQASVVLSNVQGLTEQLPGDQAQLLDDTGASTADAAQALLSIAQVSAPCISKPEASRALISAAERLRNSSSKLTGACNPHVEDNQMMKQNLLSNQKKLEACLDALVKACSIPKDDVGDDVNDTQQKELSRLKFIKSISGVKDKLQKVENEWGQTTSPPTAEQQQLAQHRLQQQLARLNAAVAALASATADGENIDHESAEKATRTISELLPLIMHDGDIATYGQDETSRTAMLDHLKSLCNATRNICAAAGEGQGIPSSAADFAAASNKLTFLISPYADRSKEEQIMDLTASACAQASVVLSNVQGLTEQLPGDQAQLLDDTGASTADAAQALLSIAQVSAPCISKPEASRALISAAERLRNSSSKLTGACNPHVEDNQMMKQNLLSNQKKLEACLDALVEACPIPEGMSQKEKRLQFVKSASSAKGCLTTASELLDKPIICQMMREEDYKKLQRELCQRVAELYSAMAVLEDAGADGENLDYGKATRAVNSIKELMPLVVRDARAVCGYKTDDEQAELLQRVRELCEATSHLCDCDNDTQGVNNAAAKFGTSSKKLVFLISPPGDKAKEKQITELSSAAFSQASSLASNMRDAGHHVDVVTGSDLIERADKVSEGAKRLKALAQILAPTVQDTDSSNELLSAIAQLHSAANVPEPYALPSPHQQKIRDDTQLLKDTLNKMAVACNARQVEVPDETSRRLLVDRALHARDSLSATRRMSIEPVICQMMREEDGQNLQQQLYQRLAQLAAAVASLESLNTVCNKPNYLEAVKGITEVKDLMPLVVQDARTLCGTKPEEEKAALLHQIQELCDATTAICSNADNPKGLNEAASRFKDSSKKLVFLISPSADPNKEIQITGLSTAVHNQASALAGELHRASSNADGATAAELENKRDKIIEAANRLQAVAQVLAPALQDPTCCQDLQSAVCTLRSVSVLPPHTLQQQAHKLQHCSLQLQQALDKLEHACPVPQGKQIIQLSPEQEKQRLKFINSVSEAKNNLQATELQLTQPLKLSPMAPEEVSPTQKTLAKRRSRLDAAIDALNGALQGQKNRNYEDADKALREIMDLIPLVVQDARKLVAADKAPVDVLVDVDAKCKSVQKLLNKLEKEKLQADNKADVVSKTDKPVVVEKKVKPPVPVRDRRSHVEHNKGIEMTEDFIKRLRDEELREKQANEKALEKQQIIDKFSEAINDSKEQLQSAQQTLQTLQKTKNSTSGSVTPAVEVTKREQRMEDNLAAAGVQVAQLVAANYADQLDYEAALKPTENMTQCVKQIIEDGAKVSGCLEDKARTAFIADLLGLCEATNNICEAAKSDKKKLNEAAISFGDQSAKVLRVVSADINPELEREVISKAKAIGDSASRIALEAGNMATDSSFEDQANVKQICEAGASCVDAAGKLVYTAKLVSPTIGHKISQNALITSADNLHSSVETFSKSWESSASKSHMNLSQELEKLKQLLQKLQNDVKGGKFGSREVERHVVIDTPLREMTLQVIENAKNMSQLSELSPELRQKYTEYSSQLTQAMQAVDVASARFQRAPRDNIKREQMEMAIQELQMSLLQSRPSRSEQAHSDIVDFRDFLQDMAAKAQELQTTAKTHKTAIGNDIEPITVLCSKILEDANKLLNPDDVHHDTTVMTSEDDVVEIEQFGQDSEVMLKEINATINGIRDQKAKSALKTDALSLYESCQLLRFATNCHIAATKSAAFDEALLDLDSFEKSILTPLATDVLKKKKEKKAPHVDSGTRVEAALQRSAAPSGAALSAALQQMRGGAPARVSRALAQHAAEQLAHAHGDDDLVLDNLKELVKGVQEVTRATSFRIANWDNQHHTDTPIYKKLYDNNATNKSKLQILTEDDLDKLLSCDRIKVEGTRMQLEDKLQQLSSKLSSMCGTIVMSVKKPESLARSSHATAECANHLANVARSLKDNRRPVEAKRIEEATQNMCLSTCNLLKTSELVCEDSGHHAAKRRLLDACRLLNDSINNLERVVSPSATPCVTQECERAQRCSAVQRSLLQRGAALPTAAVPYGDCLDTLTSQKDVFNKLNSKEALTRDQFIQSLHYITSAVNNSADCATHAAYLLTLSETDLETAKQGLVDVAKLQKQVAGVQETCVNIIMDLNTDQFEHELPEKKKQLEREVTDLLKDLDDAVEKTKDPGLKSMLVECRKEVDTCAKSFYILVQAKTPKESLMSSVISLMYEANYVGGVLEHPGLVPAVGNVSADTLAQWEEVTKCTGDLITSTQDLIKEVKTSQHPDVMTWVVFNKRKNVLDAFDALIKTVRLNGHRVNLIEGGLEDTEDGNKSYIQSQVDLAFKWLKKSTVKPEVKANGQQAIQNILDIARKMQEDVKDNDEDDMSHLVVETEQLLVQCSSKYDQEHFSVLVERVRELQKVIERGIVTRVIEDFMEAEAPLADLDIMTDAETDEKKRKFILERKIAELLAHLGRATKTARLIADTGSGGQTVATELKTCSEQTELLAPMLVKAAEERIKSPNNEVIIENYKSLLARYAESMSKVRDLCDQSVDPMDFVQTASVTMQRMREESTKHNDPMKCAYTSSVITKLANRVIQVGLSSSPVREDPELYRALTDAQTQLSAATPAPDTRHSRMPDWKDTTALIIRATDEVESVLGGESIFKKQPEPDQPIYNEALNLHVAIRDWSSRDNEIVAVAKKMAVLMAKLSDFMKSDKQRDVLTTSKNIVTESHEVARLAKKLAHECTDHRIKTNLLQACERIPTISGQLKMLTTVKGSSLGHHGTKEDKEAMDMLVGNAQSLMSSISDVVKAAASASVKIMSQRGPRIKWVRKNYY